MTTDTDPFSTSAPRPTTRYGESDVRRDHLGRYLIPQLPDDWDGTKEVHVDPTNNEVSWTRVTTFSDALANSYSINAWRQRLAVSGLSRRPDLIALAASTPFSNKKALDDIAKQARDFAGENVASNLGTAIHQFTESQDRGEEPDVPAPWNTKIEEYQALLKYYRIEVLPKYIELQVVMNKLVGTNETDRYGVAGTFDRIVLADVDAIRQFKKTGEWPETLNLRPTDMDFKTGKDLFLGEKEITIQQWLYANADAIWDRRRQVFMPMPEGMRRDAALIMWLPLAEDTGDVLVCDLTHGERGAILCFAARAWQSKTLKGLIEGADKPLRARRATEEGPVAPTADPDPIMAQKGTEPVSAPVPAGTQATGRKCGVCGERGHNARTCPNKNGASAAPVLTLVPDDALPPAPTNSIAAAGTTVDTMVDATTADEKPWCMCTSRTGWTNPGDGQPWVCSECGKPSRVGMMNGTGKPASAGMSAQEAQEALERTREVSGAQNDAESAEDDVQPDPFASPATDPFPSAKSSKPVEKIVDKVMDAVNAAKTKPELNDIARAAKAIGKWTDEHKARGMARIQAGEIQ